MSNDTPISGAYAASLDRLFSGNSPSNSGDGGSTQLLGLSDALAGNSTVLTQLSAAIQAQAESLAANTKALTQSKTTEASSGESKATSVAKSVGSSLLGGLTLAPLVRGLMSLFGGGSDDTTATTVTKYELPASLAMDGGVTAGASAPVAIDYDQYSKPRAVQTQTAAAGQITVNVQAMDSQSFLDRSDDIARAVKKAMLESNSLNDIVAEV